MYIMSALALGRDERQDTAYRSNNEEIHIQDLVPVVFEGFDLLASVILIPHQPRMLEKSIW
jgi:hypothetical protein